ncbi:predicted protein [Uncinocarpus reesii 1704]|uniref:Uncharacterized protein n=1 Tax=Uncinocarpus reesii (strain UAMH 1704) TaxID=336963 RepID=C4JH05_UNCRE|nr:uncharacterized protein UREG_01256 [Uncinocarpus reesii 1704]EEP76407.1 predicted protein [Uncinocarpus reesii 1704]
MIVGIGNVTELIVKPPPRVPGMVLLAAKGEAEVSGNADLIFCLLLGLGERKEGETGAGKGYRACGILASRYLRFLDAGIERGLFILVFGSMAAMRAQGKAAESSLMAIFWSNGQKQPRSDCRITQRSGKTGDATFNDATRNSRSINNEFIKRASCYQSGSSWRRTALPANTVIPDPGSSLQGLPRPELHCLSRWACTALWCLFELLLSATTQEKSRCQHHGMPMRTPGTQPRCKICDEMDGFPLEEPASSPNATTFERGFRREAQAARDKGLSLTGHLLMLESAPGN